MNKQSRNLTTAEIRQLVLTSQHGICPVCEREILPEQACLDHDHKAGLVRAVLHRNCNQLESKLRGLIKRFGLTQLSSGQLLHNLENLWSSDQHLALLHPDHLTSSKKQAKALRKRLRSIKTEAARERYRAEIQRLTDEHRAFMSEGSMTKEQLEKYLEDRNKDRQAT